MADVTLDKATLQKKITTWKIVLFAVIIIAAGLLAWVIVVQVKKYKQNKLAKSNTGTGTNTNTGINTNTNTGVMSPPANNSGSGGSGGGAPPAQTNISSEDLNSASTIKSIQHMLNVIIARQPGQPLLAEDGILGPLTKAALISVNSTFYPLTQNALLQLSTMAADANQ